MNRCLFLLVLASCAAGGCNAAPEYRVTYTQAVTELKAMYPIPTSDDAEYRKALVQAYPAYSPEALAVPGFPIQWDLVVSAAEISPNLEFRVNILKNWKLQAARRTSITVQAVGALAVRVNVVSERQMMGGDTWMRDGIYEMQRRNELERRFKALATRPAAPAAQRTAAPTARKASGASVGEAAEPIKPVPAAPPERSGRPAGQPGRGAAAAPVPPMAPPPNGSVNDEPQTIP